MVCQTGIIGNKTIGFGSAFSQSLDLPAIEAKAELDRQLRYASINDYLIEIRDCYLPDDTGGVG